MPMATTMQMTMQAKAKAKAEAEEKKRQDGADGADGNAPSSRRPSGAAELEEPPLTGVKKYVCGCLDVVNGTAFQTLLYFVFVIIFQNLVSSMRMWEEFYLSKHVMDRVVENHFDSSHNTFESVRRVADIYEWGNNVLWPGLLGDLGPCQSDVGDTSGTKSCKDNVWPDGEGSFHLTGATAYSVSEMVEQMDLFDWTDGVLIKQGRAAPASCSTTEQMGECFPEISQHHGHSASKEAFGYNWTHPDKPLYHEWRHFSVDELGSNPDGVMSAAIPSMRTYDTAGYIALVIPFFSDTFLVEEQGTAKEVTDYRDHYINATNGRTPRYFCVRLSPNGHHIRQLCDPNSGGTSASPNPDGRTTGVVRRAIEELWNDLKRGHFIDSRTRVVTITLQLRSNPLGIRYKNTLMFELSTLGAIFPSYDVETRVLDSKQLSDMKAFAAVALAMVIFFTLLEGVELLNGEGGIGGYFSDMWNVMDWANFIVYYMVYAAMGAFLAALDETPRHKPCTNYLCAELGYFDDWKVMAACSHMKLLLSLCVCIQLLKVLKFMSNLVPKMSLATAVLRKCVVDLAFFGFAFMISVFAFSNMLSLQLGPVMEAYIGQVPAFISLFRALFGDFDINEILDSSRGYTNAILFLAYLFVAIFIMLSVFLAILAEAQVAVREDEKAEKEENEKKGVEWDEFGVITAGWRQSKRTLASVRQRLKRSSTAPASDAEPHAGSDAAEQPASPASTTGRLSPDGKESDVMMAQLLQAVERLQADVSLLRERAAITPFTLKHPAPSLPSNIPHRRDTPPSSKRAPSGFGSGPLAAIHAKANSIMEA